MKKSTFAKSLLIIALAVLPLTFFGQNENGNENQKKEKGSYWYVGFDEGATLLFGDNKSFDFKNVRPELSINGGYVFAKHFGVYGRVAVGTLRGELEHVFTVNNASFISYDLNVNVDLISLFLGYNPDRVFGLKPHVGFGQLQYQARTTLANGTVVKYGYDDATTTVKGNGIAGRKVVWEVPMGVELEFNINRNIALLLDVMTTYTDTDDLEAVTGGDHYDWFSGVNVGFRYKFRAKKPVPQPEPAAPDCEACKEAIQDAVKEAVEEALKDYQPAPAAEPAREEAKAVEKEEPMKNFEERDIHLTFTVGKAEVKNTQANKDEVKKISEDMDNGREIHTIKTLGYASPEGNEEQNNKLAADRAQATSDFIETQLGEQAKGITFDAEGMGSDWDGFYEALRNSNIAQKAEIENAIKNSEEPTATLNQMKAKYPQLGEILNSLRVTRVYINK